MSDSDEEALEREYREREFAYIKLWPTIREEFKNGSKKEEAFRNVYRKLGRNPPSYPQIHDWLEQYYGGDIGEEIGDFHEDVRSAVIGQYLKLQNAIYFCQDLKFFQREAVLYNRFMFVYSNRYPNIFAIIDSFSGEQRALKGPTRSIIVEHDFYHPIWIDPTHILAKKYENSTTRFILLKIDLEESKWAILDNFVSIFQCARAIIDSVDRTKFLIVFEGPNSTFIHRGHITEDRIVVEEQSVEIFAKLQYPKLENNQLYGFQRVRNEENNRQEWHFEKYVLHLNFANKVSSVRSWFRNTNLDEGYIWSKSRLFVLVYYFDWPKYFKVSAFDSWTHSWRNTQIVGTAMPTSINIDEDDVLTVGTVEGDWIDNVWPTYKTMHRFSMRKPEKLSYLAWFTIRRGKMLLGNDLHDKLQLPYTCEFRPFF